MVIRRGNTWLQGGRALAVGKIRELSEKITQTTRPFAVLTGDEYALEGE